MENYNPKEDDVVKDFIEELKSKIPSYLRNIALYGSRACGDNKKYSDYDFMVLLKEKNDDVSEIIYDIGYGILDKHEKLASCLIWNEKDWEFHQKFPIGKNILRDGVWML